MRTILLACAAVLGLAGAASAQIYKCEMKNRGPYHGISEVIFFNYEPDKPKETWVYDGVTKARFDRAVAAKLVRDDDTILKIKWIVPAGRTKKFGAEPRVDYSLTVYKKKGKATAYGDPRVFDNTFQADGACKPYKKK